MKSQLMLAVCRQKSLANIFVTVLCLSSFCNVCATVRPLPEFDRVRILEQPVVIQDVDLRNQDGEKFSLADLHGTVALVFFGFTNCPDVCPTTMARLRSLQASSDYDEHDLAYVMISVDGERDTPEQMRDFLSGFSAEFIGLTGSPAITKKIASQFRASFFKGNIDTADGSYTVAHTPQVFVVDAEGRLRAELYNASFEATTGTIDALLAEKRSSAASSAADE